MLEIGLLGCLELGDCLVYCVWGRCLWMLVVGLFVDCCGLGVDLFIVAIYTVVVMLVVLGVVVFLSCLLLRCGFCVVLWFGCWVLLVVCYGCCF